MKTTRTLWTLFVALSGATALAQNGVVDLTKLHNYANQPRPAYITRDNTPSNNAITDAGATLGRILFYDKRLSRNSTVSCSAAEGLTYRFESSTDLSQWNLITTVTTDASGLIDRTVPMPYLNQFFRFTYIP